MQMIRDQEAGVAQIFNEFINASSPTLARYKPPKTGGVWYRNKSIEKVLDDQLQDLHLKLSRYLKAQSTTAWELSSRKTDLLVADYVHGMNISEVAREGLFDRNAKALEAFQKRRVGNLDPSARIWKVCDQAKENIEYYLQSGIGAGQGASQISRDVRGMMKDPDKLFRRVRDPETGKLKPSRPMKNYHPGRGKYRSSYKNALRMVRTETNMAYRFADQERWKKMDFVIGYEVRLSGSHPEFDICFTAWNVKVMTSEGPKNIVSVKVGDLVLTHKGKYQRVTKLYRSTIYEVKKTEISYKWMYDNRGKEHLISATYNHPFLVNGEWKRISEIKEGDKVKVLANKCKSCGTLIPHHREYCSKSCASLNTATNQWKNEDHRKGVSKKRQKVIAENNGRIPWLKEYVASGKNIDNLLNPYTIKKRVATLKKNIAKKVAKGEFHFQDPEVHKRANQALGKYHNSTFIEKKIEWLLGEKGIDFEKGVVLERKALNKFGRPRIFKPDFVLPGYDIVIECDGEYWHQDKEADLARQKEIEDMGYRVLRFPGKRIREDLKSCSEEIDRVLMNHNGEYEFMDVEISHVRHYTQKQSTPITKYNLEVENDNSYIVNGFVVHNCDSMVGKYPKTFVFGGWHPNCYCHTVPILAEPDAFVEQLVSDKPVKGHIRSIPGQARQYIQNNTVQIKRLSTTPYWVKDNFTLKDGKYIPRKALKIIPKGVLKANVK